MAMRRHILLLSAAIALACAIPVQADQSAYASPLEQSVYAPNPQTDCVILLHGLARTTRSMRKMDHYLSEKGYRVVNQGYASRKFSISDLAKPTIDTALERCADTQRISFVTHSLGGILLRKYLAHNDIEKFHRAVMLGPPNQGSEVPDKMGHWPGFKKINGPAGLELGTEEDSVPPSLPAANFDVGIIAGKRTINFILSSIIPDKDDGKVSIENTKLEGMNDHIVLPITHPFLMKNKKALLQVSYYLEHGRFDHPETEPSQEDSPSEEETPVFVNAPAQ